MQSLGDLSITNDHYCTKCHSEIEPDCTIMFSPDVARLLSWCEGCRDVVEVTSCKVPYWTVVATASLGLAVGRVV